VLKFEPFRPLLVIARCAESYSRMGSSCTGLFAVATVLPFCMIEIVAALLDAVHSAL